MSEKIEPTVEQPEEITEVSEEDIKKEILSSLAELGVNSAQDLSNMHMSSQQSGRLANMLGEAKNEIKALQAQIDNMNRSQYDDYNVQNTPASLTPDDIERVMANFYQKNILEPQQRLTQEYTRQMNEIQSDPSYNMVSEIWEAHQKNPNVIQRIQSGQTRMVDEFNKVSKMYLMRMFQAQQDVKSKVKTPHMENRGATVPDLPDQNDKKDALNSIIKNRKEGSIDSDRALAGMINAIFSDGPQK